MAVASSDSDTNPISPYEYSYLLPNYSSTSTSAVNLDTYDIHTAAVSKISEATRNEYNIKWRLKFVLNDGIEDSKPVNYPSGGKFYTICTNVGERLDLSNVNSFDEAKAMDDTIVKRGGVILKQNEEIESVNFVKGRGK